MSERFTVIVEVECASNGSLRFVMRPVDPSRAIRVRPSHLAVTVWTDGEDLVRLAIQHRRSRTLAYVQGNRALRELAEKLRFELTPAAAESAP
ncbi:MAG: hypothetical protein JO036_17310 [Candidatus Eremiobacteraeota bacterium]|nr:hypothetical protein [Candidatus Eremiobacteraeota bacterium]